MASDDHETPFIIPQDVPPPLREGVESLSRIIGNASQVRRHTQKIMHLIARCIEIIEDLKVSINAQPSTVEDMIRVVRSVPSLKVLLTKFDGAVSKEVPFSASTSHQMVATWESSRNEFRQLLNEACHPQFKPFIHWEQDLEQVTRVDDHIWVSFIVQDMQGRGSDLNTVQQAELIASRLLGEEDQVAREKDIQTAMNLWFEPLNPNSLAQLGDDSLCDPSSIFPVVGAATRHNVPNEPSSSQAIQVPSSSFAENPPLVPTVDKNELERELDLLAHPPEAFGHAVADVSQLPVGSSSNTRQNRWTNPLDHQSSTDTAAGKRSDKASEAYGRRPSTDPPFMIIHNLSQQRIISMMEATFPEGPRHSEIWTSTITISSSFNGLGVGTHTAQASTKQDARNAASARALIALGYDHAGSSYAGNSRR